MCIRITYNEENNLYVKLKIPFRIWYELWMRIEMHRPEGYRNFWLFQDNKVLVRYRHFICTDGGQIILSGRGGVWLIFWRALPIDYWKYYELWSSTRLEKTATGGVGGIYHSHRGVWPPLICSDGVINSNTYRYSVHSRHYEFFV